MDCFRLLSEVFVSIRQNRTRSVLSGFGVAWGIFMLTILLGIGDGFRNGVMSLFEAFAQKSVFVYGSTDILFSLDDIGKISRRYSQIEAVSPEINAGVFSAAYNGRSAPASVCGVSPDYFRVKLIGVSEGGRLMNEIDVVDKRQVAVIGGALSQALFRNEEALGRNVDIDGVHYMVIGVMEEDSVFSMSERNTIYIPYRTLLEDFAGSDGFQSFCLTLSGGADIRSFESDLRQYLSYIKGFRHDDDQVVHISDIENQTSGFERLFKGMNLLIWVVGICFLLSGITCVCNVMLITVKERTAEIGIRRAVGAMPESIIRMVLLESVCITFISGVVGIVMGICALLLIDKGIQTSSVSGMVAQVSVNGPAIVLSLVILVISGAAAGLVPAFRASGIMPVDAIRYENRG